ncbi:MAG: monovalent cation/H+ antiporter complex subunit F [Verrucomicrobiota bacterium]
MTSFFIIAGILIFLLMIPYFVRMITGPTAIDRIMAVNAVGTKTSILLVLMGSIFHRVEMFVDFALAYALLNFIGSLAAARYIHQKSIDGDSNAHKSQPATTEA